MAVIFPRWTNKIPQLLAVGGPIVLIGVVSFVWYFGSPWFTDVGYQPEQPVAFSHALHAGELGLDCRYCHNAVEISARAAVPPTATCMNCHASIKVKSEKLALVRDSAKTNTDQMQVNYLGAWAAGYDNQDGWALAKAIRTSGLLN